jgi:hypothetical protein
MGKSIKKSAGLIVALGIGTAVAALPTPKKFNEKEFNQKVKTEFTEICVENTENETEARKCVAGAMNDLKTETKAVRKRTGLIQNEYGINTQAFETTKTQLEKKLAPKGDEIEQ